MKFGDITITEWNYASDLPSELYKINAGYFIYAYYDKPTGTFFRPVMVNVSDLLLAIVNRKIRYGEPTKNEKDQSFLPFQYDELKKLNLVRFYRHKVSSSAYATTTVGTNLVPTPRLL